MLTSDKQLVASQKALALLYNLLDTPSRKNLPKELVEGNRKKIREDVSEIEAEISEYESLRKQSSAEISIESFDDLLTAPIRYRLSAHMSVDTFARKVKVSARQINRYEAREYTNTSIENLKKIVEALGIRINGVISV